MVYDGNGGFAPFILKLYTRKVWLFTSTHRPL